MTEEDLAELLSDCPTLFHMAAAGSWPSIQNQGLLSTSTLLDRYNVSDRERIEDTRRNRSETIRKEGLPDAVIRDQLPMDDKGLRRALPPRLRPADWYRLLNGKVFFWLTRERLLRLLSAAAYRDEAHDVLELDSASLVFDHRERVWVCPINSGCTKPFPHPRDESIFSRIEDYPYQTWRRKRKRGERVVELAVDNGVANVAHYVRRVVRMQGNRVVCEVF